MNLAGKKGDTFSILFPGNAVYKLSIGCVT